MELVRERDRVVRELAPAVVGLGARQDEDVAVADPPGHDVEVRPLQLGEVAVLDAQRGPASAVVEQRVAVDRRDAGAALCEERGRARGSRARVDPRVERDDHQWLDELLMVEDAVEAHADSI